MKILLRGNCLPIIKTKRLVLRDIEVRDITSEYIRWLNDPEVNKYLEIRFVHQTKEKVQEYVQSALEDTRNKMHFGVYDKGGRRLVGTVTLPHIDWNHHFADISFVIGHPEAYEKGYATEAVHGVIYYVFRMCKLEKLYGGYYQGHEKSANVFRKNGFQIEGRILKKFIDYKNQRVDHIIEGLLSNDFKPDEKFLGKLPAQIDITTSIVLGGK